MKSFIFLILFVIFFSAESFSKEEEKKISLRAGYYVYHALDHKKEYVEGFDNQFLALGISVSESSEVVAGTLRNSYGDRCAFLGFGKDWYHFNEKVSFQGLYAYVGELFVDQFANCGNQGIYRSFNNALGLGFAPYLYHGFKFKLASNFSIEAGIIAPKVVTVGATFEF